MNTQTYSEKIEHNPAASKLERADSRSSRAFSAMQRLGQSLMLPVSVLPAAGLLVALSRSIETWGGAWFNALPWVKAFTVILFQGGIALFENLPLIFAIGVASGFSGGAGIAGLAAVVGHVTMTNVLQAFGDFQALSEPINTGVFGGILVGLLAAKLYKKYYNIQLHPVLGFFSGKRFVPIACAFWALCTGLLLGFGWPSIQEAINHVGHVIMNSPYGPGLFAAGKRLLIPVGLHHVYYPPLMFEFGEFVNSAGDVFRGESARYFAGDPTAGRFMAAEFPLMLFGLPAASLAMYLRAKPGQKTAVAGIMMSAALTSLITGITEPIEFSFIFVAWPLFAFHVAMAFISGLLTQSLGIHLGYTFSASIIDYVIGSFNQQNGYLLFLVVGPLVFASYFGVFYWAIGQFNFLTPGRGEGSADELGSKAGLSLKEKAPLVVQALGGKDNITSLDACITRLRVRVKEGPLVNEKELRSLGASGVLKVASQNFQIIFGTQSDALKEEMKNIKSSAPSSSKVDREKTLKAPTKVTPTTKCRLQAFMKGEMVPIGQVPDPTFSQKLVGDGVAIRPQEGLLTAPQSGTIIQLFETGHALGLQTKEGLEILLHIGINTVNLKGSGFYPLKKVGDIVKAGEPLIQFDLPFIEQKAKSSISVMVVTNMDRVKQMRTLTPRGEEVEPRGPLLEVETT